MDGWLVGLVGFVGGWMEGEMRGGRGRRRRKKEMEKGDG